MYTGLIDHCGEIVKIEIQQGSMSIWIKTQFTQLQLGESIALDGICVTIAEIKDFLFKCELSPETLALTTAKNFQIGHKVNLERSLRLTDRLGGHWVMGHIDTTAFVKTREEQEGFSKIIFSGLKPETKPFIIKKGSIAVNGVSLTVNEIEDTDFAVMLIPHTQHITNLQYLRQNDLVNIEFDILARIVAHQLQVGADA